MTIGKLIEGLQLLASCEEKGLDAYCVAAEHDTLYAGPVLSKVPDEIGKKLEALGWHKDDDSWAAFT